MDIKKIRKIAIEEHVSIPELTSVGKEIEDRLQFPSLTDPDRMKNVLGPVMNLDPAEHRLPLMDKFGVDIQVLSAGGGAIQYDINVPRAVSNAKFCNDIVYNIVKKYPNRFLGFGILAMQDIHQSLQELERCKKELGFVGIMLHGSTNFSYYDEPQYYPLWEKLQEYDFPIYIHVGSPEADQIRMYDGYPEILGNTWNWGVVGGTHALRIIFGGIFERFPNSHLILGHMGENLPYVLGRADEGYACRNVKKMKGLPHEPSYYFKKNVYITTSGKYYPEAMACAVQAIGVEHILFANDYPHYPLEDSIQHIDACNMNSSQLDMILYKNAEMLFHIK